MIDFGRHRHRRTSPDLTPMIDVVFLLLIFFMLTSVFARPMLPLNLPEASGADMEREPETSITLHADGTLFMDNGPISPTDLPAALAVRFAGKQRPAISLRADKGVPFGEVVTVMDQAKTAGAVDISVVTEAGR